MLDKIFVVSRFNESFEWVKEYADNYIIYNKGNPILNDTHVFNTPNIGGNQKDMFHFICTNYDSLPKMMIFVQANPFDHCKKEIFDVLIENKGFTPLEYYGLTPANGWEARTEDGGFMEINNNWYIAAANQTYGLTCKFNTFDDFMKKYFENYEYLDFLRFSPGSQYMVKKQQIKQYPKKFWLSLLNELNANAPFQPEGHVIERALYYIFTGAYRAKKEFYE